MTPSARVSSPGVGTRCRQRRMRGSVRETLYDNAGNRASGVRAAGRRAGHAQPQDAVPRLRRLRTADEDPPRRRFAARRDGDLLGGASGRAHGVCVEVAARSGRLGDDHRDLRPPGPAVEGHRALGAGRSAEDDDHDVQLRRRGPPQASEHGSQRGGHLAAKPLLHLRQSRPAHLRATPGEGRIGQRHGDLPALRRPWPPAQEDRRPQYSVLRLRQRGAAARGAPELGFRRAAQEIHLCRHQFWQQPAQGQARDGDALQLPLFRPPCCRGSEWSRPTPMQAGRVGSPRSGRR